MCAYWRHSVPHGPRPRSPFSSFPSHRPFSSPPGGKPQTFSFLNAPRIAAPLSPFCLLIAHFPRLEDENQRTISSFSMLRGVPSIENSACWPFTTPPLPPLFVQPLFRLGQRQEGEDWETRKQLPLESHFCMRAPRLSLRPLFSTALRPANRSSARDSGIRSFSAMPFLPTFCPEHLPREIPFLLAHFCSLPVSRWSSHELCVLAPAGRSLSGSNPFLSPSKPPKVSTLRLSPSLALFQLLPFVSSRPPSTALSNAP